MEYRGQKGSSPLGTYREKSSGNRSTSQKYEENGCRKQRSEIKEMTSSSAEKSSKKYTFLGKCPMENVDCVEKVA